MNKSITIKLPGTKLDGLRVAKAPLHVRTAAYVYNSSEGFTVIITKNGSLCSTKLPLLTHKDIPYTRLFYLNVIQAAYACGRLTKAERDTAIAATKKMYARDHRAANTSDLVRPASIAVVKLNKTQLKQLNKYVEG